MKGVVKMKSKKLSYNKILVLFSIIVVLVLMTGCNGGAPPIVNIFSAIPSTINQGGSSTLTWSVSDADTVTITPGVGPVASSGSTSVSLVVTTVYTLTATNSAGSVTATVTITISVSATGLPDLVISSLTHSPASPTTLDQITFTAVVKNIGTGSAGASTLSFQIGGESIPPTFSVPALAPGATHTVQRQLVLGVAQNYINTAIADVNNDVTESDETNNQRTDTFSVSGPPDLVISSLTHSPASPTTLDQITFTAVVKNIGTGSAGASTLSFQIGGESIPPTFSVPALAPGATHTVQRQLVLGVAQNYINTAIADVNNDVTESDETNNQRTDTFSVS